MKNLLIILIFSAICPLLAQVPHQFSFQGVARGADGKAQVNKPVGLRITIRKDDPNGQAVYQETHSATTSGSGVFTVAVGKGTSPTGNFSDIDWVTEKMFLDLEMDIAGGSNYVSLGSSQLLSVPYALHAQQSAGWQNGQPIVQTGEIDQGGYLDPIGKGVRLVWYPRKAVFRAGGVQDGAWDSPSVGEYSAAFGFNTIANVYSLAFGASTAAEGIAAVAGGQDSKAEGAWSVALGENTLAKSMGSFAMGARTQAIGNYASAFGNRTVAKGYGATAIGTYNDIQDDGLNSADSRVFQVGIGTSENTRANALTVLRNGKVGIGQSVLAPQYFLDIAGRSRIRHQGETAGLFFDGAQNEAVAFVGMKQDDQVGLYIGDAWRFWVNAQGNGYLNGNILQTSDLRLKQDIRPIGNSIGKLMGISGYHYRWRDVRKDPSVQTGLLAQEVEKFFPELVSVDKDGMKSVNYVALIPHLVQALKELNTRIDKMEQLTKTNSVQSVSEGPLRRIKAVTANSKVQPRHVTK